MKPDTHPKYNTITVKCSCGNSFTTGSTINKDTLNVEVCSNCHPFYTGEQRLSNTSRVQKFRDRYNQKS